MTRNSSYALTAACCLLALGFVANAAQQPQQQPQQRPRQKTKPNVQKIFVDEMGPYEESERFRLMLEEHLLKKGFEVVLRPLEADAVLSGILSIQHFEYNSDASVTVRLISQTGDVIWAKDFARKRFTLNPFAIPETPQRRAQQVAEAMWREFKKPKTKNP